MASVNSPAVAIPSFTGLEAGATPAKVSATAKVPASPVPRLSIKASLKDLGVAVTATAASAILASNALAVEVKLGSDDGSLAFVPSVSSGEKIVFKNNAGFPHNVIFDKDEIPSGVKSLCLMKTYSMPQERLTLLPCLRKEVTVSTAFLTRVWMIGKVTVN